MLVNIKNEIKVYFERKANLVLECEIEEYLKEHKVSRNGYYTRFLETKYERLRLKVPRLRQKGFCPSLFYPYQRQDKDFSNILESICSSCKSIQEKQEIISSNYGLFYSKTFIKNFSNKVQVVWRLDKRVVRKLLVRKILTIQELETMGK